eukprot:GDKJ01038951.1.p1 GENE.GDKJ01038951.1~~GDKJ01038951.1.p1  ORF type:complete len:933 (+),score=267.73 GDKJ01038951.1:2512-5310(+)
MGGSFTSSNNNNSYNNKYPLSSIVALQPSLADSNGLAIDHQNNNSAHQEDKKSVAMCSVSSSSAPLPLTWGGHQAILADIQTLVDFTLTQNNNEDNNHNINDNRKNNIENDRDEDYRSNTYRDERCTRNNSPFPINEINGGKSKLTSSRNNITNHMEANAPSFNSNPNNSNNACKDNINRGINLDDDETKKHFVSQRDLENQVPKAHQKCQQSNSSAKTAENEALLSYLMSRLPWFPSAAVPPTNASPSCPASTLNGHAPLPFSPVASSAKKNDKCDINGLPTRQILAHALRQVNLLPANVPLPYSVPTPCLLSYAPQVEASCWLYFTSKRFRFDSSRTMQQADMLLDMLDVTSTNTTRRDKTGSADVDSPLQRSERTRRETREERKNSSSKKTTDNKNAPTTTVGGSRKGGGFLGFLSKMCQGKNKNDSTKNIKSKSGSSSRNALANATDYEILTFENYNQYSGSILPGASKVVSSSILKEAFFLYRHLHAFLLFSAHDGVLARMKNDPESVCINTSGIPYIQGTFMMGSTSHAGVSVLPWEKTLLSPPSSSLVARRGRLNTINTSATASNPAAGSKRANASGGQNSHRTTHHRVRSSDGEGSSTVSSSQMVAPNSALIQMFSKPRSLALQLVRKKFPQLQADVSSLALSVMYCNALKTNVFINPKNCNKSMGYSPFLLSSSSSSSSSPPAAHPSPFSSTRAGLADLYSPLVPVSSSSSSDHFPFTAIGGPRFLFDAPTCPPLFAPASSLPAHPPTANPEALLAMSPFVDLKDINIGDATFPRALEPRVVSPFSVSQLMVNGGEDLGQSSSRRPDRRDESPPVNKGEEAWNMRRYDSNDTKQYSNNNRSTNNYNNNSEVDLMRQPRHLSSSFSNKKKVNTSAMDVVSGDSMSDEEIANAIMMNSEKTKFGVFGDGTLVHPRSRRRMSPRRV